MASRNGDYGNWGNAELPADACAMRKRIPDPAGNWTDDDAWAILEAETFTFPAGVVEGVASVAIDVHELAMLLEGIDIHRARTSARWEPPMHARPA
jgi:hypothetical protein